MAETAVDVWVDVVCPKCYVAKRRLEAAIVRSEFPADVAVTYHAFELDPSMTPGAGTPVITHLATRFDCSEEAAGAMAERTAASARPDGIVMDLERQVTANTFEAHRIVALGLAQGGVALQGAVLERLFSAVFAEGKAVDDHQVLQRLGAEAGLDEGRLGALLSGDDMAEQVRADEALAGRIGIDAVPFVIADERLSLSGTRTIEAYGELLSAARDPRRQQRQSAAGR